MAFHAPLSNECEYNLRKRGWFYVLFIEIIIINRLPWCHNWATTVTTT